MRIAPLVSRDAIVVDLPRVQPGELSVTLWVEGTRHDVRYTAPGRELSPRSDPILPVALMVAMRLGAPLLVRGEVSARLLGGATVVQPLYAMRDRRLRPVPIEAESVGWADWPGGRGTAATFSGGVDSFFTALTHLDEIDTLFYVPAYELVRPAPDLAAKLAYSMRGAAADLGKPLLEVDTNIRALIERYVPPAHSYGAGIASVALALSPMFQRVLSPAGASFVEPLGVTHPLLEPLWSTEDVEIISDGWDRTRSQKVVFVSGEAVALKWLKVCWGGYNCGRCEKCLRTMVDLRLAGRLEACRTLPDLIDLRLLARMRFNQQETSRWEYILAEAEERQDEVLATAIRTALRGGPPARRFVRRLTPWRSPHARDEFPPDAESA